MLTGAADVDRGLHAHLQLHRHRPRRRHLRRVRRLPRLRRRRDQQRHAGRGLLHRDRDGGSFQCFFPDGPSTANVKMKVQDSDGASGTDSESVQVVAVANVAPTVTAAADQTADEGRLNFLRPRLVHRPRPGRHLDRRRRLGRRHSPHDLHQDRHRQPGHQEPHLRRRPRRPHRHRQGHRQGRRQRHQDVQRPRQQRRPDRHPRPDQRPIGQRGLDPHLQLHDQRPRHRHGRPRHDRLRHQRHQGRSSDINDDTARLVRVHVPRRPDATLDRLGLRRPTPTATPATSTPRPSTSTTSRRRSRSRRQRPSVDEGVDAHLQLHVHRPGRQDTPRHVDDELGATAAQVTGSDTSRPRAGQRSMHLPRRPGQLTPSPSRSTDSDGATSDNDTQPSRSTTSPRLSRCRPRNDLSVNEGSTHTYSYTISDPGADTVDSRRRRAAAPTARRAPRPTPTRAARSSAPSPTARTARPSRPSQPTPTATPATPTRRT